MARLRLLEDPPTPEWFRTVGKLLLKAGRPMSIGDEDTKKENPEGEIAERNLMARREPWPRSVFQKLNDSRNS